MTLQRDILVIGCGNALRRDDGVGPRVAEAVAALNLPGIRAVALHQLTPELAEAIAQASGVVFVDADLSARGSVTPRRLKPKGEGQVLAHAVDPRGLLALAKKLFGWAPPAWIIAIPVEDLGFGDGLSASAEAGVQEAVEQIRARFAGAFHFLGTPHEQGTIAEPGFPSEAW